MQKKCADRWRNAYAVIRARQCSALSFMTAKKYPCKFWRHLELWHNVVRGMYFFPLNRWSVDDNDDEIVTAWHTLRDSTVKTIGGRALHRSAPCSWSYVLVVKWSCEPDAWIPFCRVSDGLACVVSLSKTFAWDAITVRPRRKLYKPT